jgi:hypothetical protein
MDERGSVLSRTSKSARYRWVWEATASQSHR